jgi:gamma-glutamylcyclotransferase (GGCT)/AIG2-like uncharacterized protein YtfP
MTNYVAVYGSLRQGLGNHRLLEQSELVGIHTVSLPYTMLDLGSFPGLVRNKWKTTPITVEVYAVDDETMESLDWLEGYPRFYNREQVEIGDKEAWIYFLADRTQYVRTATVASGDWKSYINQRYA